MQAMAARSPCPSSLPLTGTTVLVVEDQYLLAREVAAALERAGARVLGPVASSAAALAAIDAAPDLHAAVLDFELGGDNTTEALCGVLEARGVKIIVSSATDVAALPPALRRHALLSKPNDPAKLPALLMRLLS
jgi:CheY-like chemotaxis protein